MARSGDFYTDYIANSEDAERGAPLDTIAQYWSQRRWNKVMNSQDDGWGERDKYAEVPF